MAAVELLNLLRPIVATARFVAFAALALHRHPEARESVAGGSAGQETAFAHEVRRGEPLPPGRWILLDLYGTDRDPRSCEEPERFLPERFLGWPGHPYTLVPQGAGDHAPGHRCPGEWATIALVRSAVRALTRAIAYTVSDEDLRIRPSRIPPRPESGFVMRPTGAGAP